MENKKPANQSYLVSGMVLSMLLWGISWPSGKVLTRYCSVVNFSVYRYLIVIVVMFLLLRATRTSLKVSKNGTAYIGLSGLLLALYSYLFFMGIKTGSPGAGGVLVTTMNPIMAYGLGIILSRKAPSRREGYGLLLGAIAGAVLLHLWERKTSILDSGNLYFLLAALTWSIMSKITAKGGRYGTSLGFSFWQYVVTFLCLLPFMQREEAQQAVRINDALFWVNLFFSAAIVTAGATTMYFYTTTKLGAEKASSFIFLVPVCAAVSSRLLLGEQIKPHTIVGGALGIAAVYVMNARKRKLPVDLLSQTVSTNGPTLKEIPE
ncbi:MAG: DMT family transporter [Taibaiella sp.]|nr:DMT family transporter [Taibaiella sp.]